MRAFALIVLLSLAVGCAGIPAQRSNRSETRRIVLTVSQPDTSAVGLLGAPGRRYLHRRDYSATPAVDRVLSQVAAQYRLKRIEGWPIASLQIYCEVLEVPDDALVGDLIERLSADPRIDLAQPMNTFHTLAGTYDDPYANLQPALEQLEIERAHEMATGKNVLVAVIDTAVDGSHPDLSGRVRITRNLVGPQRGRKHGELHGTAVAGIIASTVNNAEGIIGVAPDVVIAALRACWPDSENGQKAECSTFSLAQAFESALQLAPQIVNLSLAGPFDPLLARLLDAALDRGIVVVAAEPESPDPEQAFPAFHPRVIAAQSMSANGDDASRWLIAAPADEILTTIPDGYGFLSGSSFAAAHVSGVVALLLERDPGLGAEEIAYLLDASSTRSMGLRSINACRALAQLSRTELCVGASASSNAGGRALAQRRGRN
jgi:hypothetical protein